MRGRCFWVEGASFLCTARRHYRGSDPTLQAQLMSRFVELEQAYHPPTDRGQPETKQLCAAAEAAAQPGAKIFVTPWRAEPAPPSTAVAGGR